MQGTTMFPTPTPGSSASNGGQRLLGTPRRPDTGIEGRIVTRRPRPAVANLDALQARMPAPEWLARLDALRRAEALSSAVDDGVCSDGYCWRIRPGRLEPRIALPN